MNECGASYKPTVHKIYGPVLRRVIYDKAAFKDKFHSDGLQRSGHEDGG